MAQGKSPRLLIEFNAVRNSDLFSNHWLENRLPLEPEWAQVRAEAYAAIETLAELWKVQSKRVEKYDGEQMLEEQFILARPNPPLAVALCKENLIGHMLAMPELDLQTIAWDQR
jgi:hypothetical protein